MRTGSHASQRSQTSGMTCPVCGSNGSRTVPSSSAEKQAATPSVINKVLSAFLVKAVRVVKSAHHFQMSPS